MKLVFHVDVKSLNANITSNAKEVHPNLVGGEGSQLMVIIVDHGYNDHQTSKGITNKKIYVTQSSQCISCMFNNVCIFHNYI
jgi:hypothetical protein